MLIGSRRRRGAAAIAGAVLLGSLGACGGDARHAATASSETSLAAIAAGVEHDVHKVWPQASKLWPGADFGKRRVILGDGREVRLISVDGVTRLTPSDLARHQVAIPSVGSVLATWEGHPTVVINTTDGRFHPPPGGRPSRTLFQHATDRLFHAGQRGWPALGAAMRRTGGQPRGTEYPMAVTPRLYRGMLYNDLVAAYRFPDERKQWLARAAYWKARWEREYPGEARRAAVSDLGEGVAGYFAGLTSAIAAGADRGDATALRRHAAYRPLPTVLDPRRVSLDGEGAQIGGVAGLILDDTKDGWKKDAGRDGRTPLTLVLEGVRPVAEPPSDGLRSAVQNALATQNSDLIPRLDPLIGRYDSADALVYLPMDKVAGVADPVGYYTSPRAPYSMVARLTGTFQTAKGSLRATGAAAFTDGKNVIIPVDTGSNRIKLHGNRLQLNTRQLAGALDVTSGGGSGRRTLTVR